jgi:hypothetical protein
MSTGTPSKPEEPRHQPPKQIRPHGERDPSTMSQSEQRVIALSVVPRNMNDVSTQI